jgi:hypothetical protein
VMTSLNTILGLLRALIRAITISLYLSEINRELKGKDNYWISSILVTGNSAMS